jgi:hypothetical protein
VFILCPKNYVYIGIISAQVALNPAVLLMASILIIHLGGLNSRHNQLAK